MNKKFLFLVLSLALIFTLIPPALASASTFQQGDQYEQGKYKLDAEHPTSHNWTRQSRYKSIDADPYVKWTFKPEGSEFTSTVAIDSDGTIYAGDANSCKVFAINSDGTEKWVFEGSTTCTFSNQFSPVIGKDGTIYANSTTGLFAINPDGTEKWFSVDGMFGVSIGEDGTIYQAQFQLPNDYSIAALNSEDGSRIWTTRIPSGLNGGASISNDGTIYLGQRGHLQTFDKDGNSLWSFDNGAGFNGNASVAIGKDGTIYMGTNNPNRPFNFFGINPDGTEKWSYPLGFIYDSAPAIDKDGTIVFATGLADRKVYAMNPDGTLKWSAHEPIQFLGFTESPIIDSSGNVYVVGQAHRDMHLFAYSSDGEKLWHLSFNGDPFVGHKSAPAIGSDGTIYMATYGGVTAIGGEIIEVPVGPPVDPPVDPTLPVNGDRALLTIELETGLVKEYDVTLSEAQAFNTWINNRLNGDGPAVYTFENDGPFTKRTDHIIYNKVVFYEINEYTK